MTLAGAHDPRFVGRRQSGPSRGFMQSTLISAHNMPNFGNFRLGESERTAPAASAERAIKADSKLPRMNASL